MKIRLLEFFCLSEAGQPNPVDLSDVVVDINLGDGTNLNYQELESRAKELGLEALPFDDHVSRNPGQFPIERGQDHFVRLRGQKQMIDSLLDEFQLRDAVRTSGRVRKRYS